MNPAHLLIAAVVGLIAFVIWLIWYFDKRRMEAWMAAGQALGFTYVRRDDSVMRDYGAFKLFGFGHSRRTKDILKGQVPEGDVVIGDYQYVTGHGKNSQLHKQTLCILKAPGMSVPHCFLRKEQRFFDFLGKVFGGQDINYNEDPEFSKAFVLQGADEQATRRTFTAGVRRHFLRYQGTYFTFEAQGDTLLIHNSRVIKPEAARDLVNQAVEIARVLMQETQQATG